MSIEKIAAVQTVALQDILQVPRDGSGRVKWLPLKEDPAKLALVVETLAKRVVWQGYSLIQRNIRAKGERSLATGVELHYPGSLDRLRKNLEIEGPRRPRGAWTKDYIEQQAREFVEEGNTLTQKALYDAGKAYLAGGIGKYYPDGLTGLKRHFGIKVGKSAKDWPLEKIKHEAAAFLEDHGQLSVPLLRKNGRSDLNRAITSLYPGGFYQLKTDLEVDNGRQPRNYWTAENVEREAAAFLKAHGNLNHNLLVTNGQGRLSSVLRRSYKGGIVALKEKLGIVDPNKESSVSVEQANSDLDSLLEGEKND